MLAVVVLLVLLEPGKLLAQQTQPGDQGWSQNDQSNGQYAPNRAIRAAIGLWTAAGRATVLSGFRSGVSASGVMARRPAQPLNAVQLEQLVAPIALYPDTLVAQVLAASTYPGQVADADHWRQTQGYASPDQIAAGADVQNWDPSVKALTAFPQVLAQMDRNLQWTTDLGNAYYNQPQDVLEAVQVMRRRAQAAGNLQSTPQQTVHYDQGYIQLMPVNPQVVYVPTYNPWTVYGEQVSPYPGFSLLGAVESFLGSSPINYGLGIAMSAFSQTPWGWLAWGLNWLAQSVLFNQSDYYSHSNTVADWGFRHDGLHAYARKGSICGAQLWPHIGRFPPVRRRIQREPRTGIRPPAGQICRELARKLQPRLPCLWSRLRPDAAPGLQPSAGASKQAAVRPQWLSDPTGTAGPVKATAAGRAHPTTVRCRPIARRPQVFSAANSGDGLPGLSRAATLRTPPENHRTRVASICLAADTRPRPLAAGAQAASTWEAAGMRRRASTAAGRISAGGTRTAEEVTPAVTAAASITAESAYRIHACRQILPSERLTQPQPLRPKT